MQPWALIFTVPIRSNNESPRKNQPMENKSLKENSPSPIDISWVDKKLNEISEFKNRHPEQKGDYLDKKSNKIEVAIQEPFRIKEFCWSAYCFRVEPPPPKGSHYNREQISKHTGPEPQSEHR